VQGRGNHQDCVPRTNLVCVPFGADLSASRLCISEMWVDAGIGLRPARAEGIDTKLGRVHPSDGEQLAFRAPHHRHGREHPAAGDSRSPGRGDGMLAEA
jgi:hypothetical protein